jgi:hypothetical protein
MGEVEKMIPPKERAIYTEKFLYKPEGSLKMAPESDKGEAINVDPAADFEDIED